MCHILEHITWSKRDVWLSREDARADLGRMPGFRNWDDKVLALFVEKGLRAHPATRYRNPFAFTGVTLACTKAREAVIYRYHEDQPRTYDLLHCWYVSGPSIHHIFSRKDEFNALDAKKMLISGVHGKGPSSMQWIEVGGHMFVQSQPKSTANAVWNALLASAGVSQRSQL
ncbi:hypothetical protein OF83DRAFT_1178867 [Amylostereum chailletii]|nr:hypothetical protein OF83DRAFT_1178867 [Amylostereum chailletii]